MCFVYKNNSRLKLNYTITKQSIWDRKISFYIRTEKEKVFVQLKLQYKLRQDNYHQNLHRFGLRQYSHKYVITYQNKYSFPLITWC